MTKEISLPSGSKIEITPAPMAEAKKLYQAIASELLRLRFNAEEDVAVLIKNVLCLSIASPEIEAALEPCLRRCTYNGPKITAETWEPVQAREDYLDVCYEVAKENVGPFTRSLFAQFKGLMAVAGAALPVATLKT